MNPQAENYWPEPCAYCDGTGEMPVLVRQALKAHGLMSLGIKESAIEFAVCCGKAFVLVLKPSQVFTLCRGTGRVTNAMRKVSWYGLDVRIQGAEDHECLSVGQRR